MVHKLWDSSAPPVLGESGFCDAPTPGTVQIGFGETYHDAPGTCFLNVTGPAPMGITAVVDGGTNTSLSAVQFQLNGIYADAIFISGQTFVNSGGTGYYKAYNIFEGEVKVTYNASITGDTLQITDSAGTVHNFLITTTGPTSQTAFVAMRRGGNFKVEIIH
jgi:hypothetical protein